MDTTRLPAEATHRLFRRNYVRRLQLCVAAGFLFHLALFALVPPGGKNAESVPPQPFDPVLPPIPSEIQISAPPAEVRAPSLPGIQPAAVPDLAAPSLPTPESTDLLDPFQAGIPGPSLGNPVFVVTRTMPEVVRAVRPTYPRLALEAGVEGMVWIEVLVDRSGRVARARVVRSEAPRVLEEAALEAARGYLFRPARQQGHTVPARVVIPFRFELR